MPHNHDSDNFVRHQLHWTPGQEGKGFLVKPTETGIKHWPYLRDAQPIVWTWPTEGLKPFHDQMKAQTPGNLPQGMTPEYRTYFHITPEGNVWSYGPNRYLDDDDHMAISNADPRLSPAGPKETPQVQSDGYGHANRLLELIGGTRIGRWVEWPQRWRERRTAKQERDN